MTPPIPSRLLRSRRSRGFTLVEAAMAVVIIGVGVLSLLQLIAAGSISTAEGGEMTTAINLANNIHEILMPLPLNDPSNPTVWQTKEQTGGVNDPTQYNDVIDFDGDTYSPPLDVSRHGISAYSNWSQKVQVQTVAQDQLSSTRPSDPTVPTARATVTILHNNVPLYQTSWLVCSPNGP